MSCSSRAVAVSASSPAEARPKTSITSVSPIGRPASPTAPQKEMIWSKMDCPSRMPPSAARAIATSAPSSMAILSAAAISRSRPAISFTDRRLRSKRWQRETMVGSTLCGSVVANRNLM
ncbi:MAG: hypothetical protein BWZ02_02190 [Lentisphaerae bacterium ADurb.BinA184]|nr:MAG: hypothetical protein BWZ02_02190 [Lentisphaerae bacterium ADurb.BinA184]